MTYFRFHLSFSSIYSMMLCKSQGVQVFLGQYTMFDNDSLLEMIKEFLIKKLKSRKLYDDQIFDENYIEAQLEQGLPMNLSATKPK